MSGAREILWNNGELITLADLNNMQRYARAQTTDWLIGALGRSQNGYTAGEHARTTNLWVYGDSGAPYPHAATARKVSHLGGPIIQWKTGTPNYLGSALTGDWGHESYALVYYLGPDEYAVTHDIGGANPRWDLVTVTLSHTSTDVADEESRTIQQIVGGALVTSSSTFVKKRKVIAIVTVTKGTEAVTPYIPIRPAGSVPLYAVYVPAAHNAVVNPEHIWDLRMPLGAFSIDMLAREYALHNSGLNLAGHLIQSGAYGAVKPADVAGELWMAAHGQQQGSCRLIGVEALIGEDCNGSDFDVMRISATYANSVAPANIASVVGSIPNISAQLRGDPVALSTEWRGVQLQTDCDTADAVGIERMPVWINGRNSSYAMRPGRLAAGTDNTLERVGMRFRWATNTAYLSMIRFNFAGGL